eukprot:GHVP01025854.1.p1 GENE.GHVP01025854.1~~GHVP01025854.1.p1  ORF type:complete len:264 (+),score=43.82 GHVP01025854.1:511-1302(+)
MESKSCRRDVAVLGEEFLESDKKLKKKRIRSMYCGVCEQFKPRSTRARLQTCRHIVCYDCVRIACLAEKQLLNTPAAYPSKAGCPLCQEPIEWDLVKPTVVILEGEENQDLINPNFWQDGRSVKEAEMIMKILAAFFTYFPAKLAYGWRNHLYSDCLMSLYGIKPQQICTLESFLKNRNEPPSPSIGSLVGSLHSDPFYKWRENLVAGLGDRNNWDENRSDGVDKIEEFEDNQTSVLHRIDGRKSFQPSRKRQRQSFSKRRFL